MQFGIMINLLPLAAVFLALGMLFVLEDLKWKR